MLKYEETDLVDSPRWGPRHEGDCDCMNHADAGNGDLGLLEEFRVHRGVPVGDG